MTALTRDEVRRLTDIRIQVATHIEGLVAFWRGRAIDERGGYFTCFDEEGRPVATETERYLLSHARLAWSFAELADATADESLLALALHGVDYILERFRDPAYGGWFWKLDRTGRVLDPAKLVYGQSFAIYALAAYGRIAHNSAAVEAAMATFDWLQVGAADVARGGYYENLGRDWAPAPGGAAGGDRKSLDIHLHLLEAFTELSRVTGMEVHRRRLLEVRSIILTHMVDASIGIGGFQYDLAFRPIDPIVIDKTWIAERIPGAAGAVLPPMTSYGHNLELGWLLGRANEVLGIPPEEDLDLVKALADHALAFGLDPTNGGIYREGPPVGPATDRDKEFWENAEALVGFLDAFRLTGDRRYLTAFEATWGFARRFLIHPAGEWRTRTTDGGIVIDGNLGNYWTGAYHTARAAIECHRRLDALLEMSTGGRVRRRLGRGNPGRAARTERDVKARDAERPGGGGD